MQGQIVLSLVHFAEKRVTLLCLSGRGKGARKPLNIIFRWGDEFSRGLGAARCPITLGADQSIFGATRRGPMRAHIGGLDLASCPCPRRWPWTSGNGGCPGLLPFSADRLEMTSRSLVEIREAAISTCPPFPPPTGDRPTLNVVGQPRP